MWSVQSSGKSFLFGHRHVQINDSREEEEKKNVANFSLGITSTYASALFQHNKNINKVFTLKAYVAVVLTVAAQASYARARVYAFV